MDGEGLLYRGAAAGAAGDHAVVMNAERAVADPAAAWVAPLWRVRAPGASRNLRRACETCCGVSCWGRTPRTLQLKACDAGRNLHPALAAVIGVLGLAGNADGVDRFLTRPTRTLAGWFGGGACGSGGVRSLEWTWRRKEAAPLAPGRRGRPPSGLSGSGGAPRRLARATLLCLDDKEGDEYRRGGAAPPPNEQRADLPERESGPAVLPGRPTLCGASGLSVTQEGAGARRLQKTHAGRPVVAAARRGRPCIGRRAAGGRSRRGRSAHWVARADRAALGRAARPRSRRRLPPRPPRSWLCRGRHRRRRPSPRTLLPPRRWAPSGERGGDLA